MTKKSYNTNEFFVYLVAECELGNYYDVTSSACKVCPRHTYQDTVGQSYCYNCQPYYVTQNEESTLATHCEGKYSKDITIVNCPLGLFCDSRSQVKVMGFNREFHVRSISH